MSNIAMIKPLTIENGTGCRVSVFLSGCHKRCPGCHNEDLWDFNYGEEFGMIHIRKILNLMNKPWIKGISILGGEPLAVENIHATMQIISSVRRHLPDKDIWLYTGMTFEECKMRNCVMHVLENVDFLVDGAFVESEKDITLAFRGSRNQRIINLREEL